MRANVDHARILALLSQDKGRNVQRLRDLINIPSVASMPLDVHRSSHLTAAAEAVRSELMAAGLQNVRLLTEAGGPPYVFGEWLNSPDSLTVLLYAHYDVQPAGDPSSWDTEPFIAVERDGRLYGRGAADDKGGVIAHLAAVTAWLKGAGQLPVNVKVLIEGEEEIGSRHFGQLLGSHLDLLKADVVVIPDSMNWEVGNPSLTCSTRGAVTAIVELRGIDHPVHSGVWGGLAPDPVMGMCRLLSTLVAPNGAIQLDGLRSGNQPAAAKTMQLLRGITIQEVAGRIGLSPVASLPGDPSTSLADRVWLEPCVTVTGFDAPEVSGAPNTIQALARARINLRLPPGVDPVSIAGELGDHLQVRTPPELQCSVTMTSVQAGWVADLESPVYAAASRALQAAYGRPVSYLGTGGTLPLLSSIAKYFRNPPCIVLGIEDPSSNAHGPNESLHLADWHKLCVAETMLLNELAAASGLDSG